MKQAITLFTAVVDEKQLVLTVPAGRQLHLKGAAIFPDQKKAKPATLLLLTDGGATAPVGGTALCTLHAHASLFQWSLDLVASSADSPLHLVAEGGPIHVSGNWVGDAQSATEPAPAPACARARAPAPAPAPIVAPVAPITDETAPSTAPAALAREATDGDDDDDAAIEEEDDDDAAETATAVPAARASKSERKAARRRNLAAKKRQAAEALGGAGAEAVLEVRAPRRRRVAEGLFVEDLALGGGAAARHGQRCDLIYEAFVLGCGVLPPATRAPDAEPFDAQMNRRRPFRFRLGLREVVAGFDRGIEGMRVGGRRAVTVPPELAYGAKGSGAVPPNATLRFEVELVDCV